MPFTQTIRRDVDNLTDQELQDQLKMLEDLLAEAMDELAYRNQPNDPPDDYDYDLPDNEADADTLRMAGWGTDEDYGYFGGAEDDF